MHKLCSISSNYIAYDISAMSSAVSGGILTGRPFGGVSTLIHDRYKNDIVSHVCSERFNIILLGKMALVKCICPVSPMLILLLYVMIFLTRYLLNWKKCHLCSLFWVGT